MKKMIRLKKLVLILLALVLLTGSVFAQEYRNGMKQGVVRIKFQPELTTTLSTLKTSYSDGIVQTGIQTLDAVNKQLSAVEMKRVFPYSPKFEEKHRKYGLHLWYEIVVSEDINVSNAVTTYQNLGEVVKAEPVLEKKLIEPSSVTPVEVPKITTYGNEPFNDPLLPRQWHYNNAGQTGQTPGCDINLYKAWEVTTGSKNVIVSVHDQGIDYLHDDLAEAMWVNQAELNGQEGVDDDGNGYIDDVHGFDFSGNKGTVDRLDHGTHVAGTIGAISNNGIGVAGIAGGSGNADGARLMSCQIIGGRSSDKVPNSFVYAADMGAVISQNSWGYTSPDIVEQAILDAIDYFIAEAGNYEGSPMKGGVVIFAAGNDNKDGNWYPGCYESCIAVAATDANNNKASYSNYGTWVDIAAPGGDHLQNETADIHRVLSTAPHNAYAYLDGTSMACPHVSGVAALVVSKYGGADFTNEALKSHLMIGTNDIYNLPFNQNYTGQLGIGITDALGALAEDGKVAPNRITNFTLTDIAQDFANFTWTVPADEDDVQAKTYKIFYYTDELTAENLKFAELIDIETTKELGDTMSYELQNLKSLTEYHFAIAGVDRWGNMAELSNIIVETTNDGPDASVDAMGTKYITIDINSTNEGSTSFNLINSGEGVLKWNTDIRRTYINQYSNDLNYPDAKPGISSTLGSVKAIASKSTNAIVVHESAKRYFDGTDSRYWTIGETDKEMPNSSATRFFVNEEKGFNLTNINARVFHNEETGPVILEIYEGNNISDARLLLAQEISETGNQPWATEIDLSEDIYFEKGEYFWIVFHVPGGNLYPLAAALELEPDMSDNCYISTNVGKSWNKLSDVYIDDQIVWQLEALSENDHFGEYIVLSPDSGKVLPNEQQEITASIDATKMPNGTYKSNIVINTNEPEEPMIRVQTSLRVKNHLPIFKAPSVTEVGSPMVGNESVVWVQVENHGYAKAYSPKLTFSDSQFELVGGSLPNLPARMALNIPIRYKPTKAGNTNAIATFTDSKGNSVSFNLVGVGTEPPVMEISEEQTFSNITIGDTIQGTFTITNTGNYPLEYSMLKFADGSNIVSLDTNTCKSGYTSRINDGGMTAEEWIDIKGIADGEVSGTFKTNATDYFSDPIEIGFDFPFFGKMESEVYLGKFGLLSFDENSTFNTLPTWYKNHYMPDRFICAQGLIYWWFASFDGEVYYKRYSDRFVVQYDKLAYDSGGEGEPTYYMTFQIILKDNGDIKFNYKNLDWMPEWTKNQLFIAIEDQTINDGVLITDAFPAKYFPKVNSTVEFLNPGFGLITSVDKPFGKVQMGDSTEISFTAITNDLNAQNYTERLAILSNDPSNNPGVFTVNFNVENGGEAKFEINKTELDFGEVFQNDTEIREFTISNTGNASINVDSMVLDNDFYTLDGESPVNVKGNRKLGYKLTLKSDAIGVYNDILNVYLNNGEVHKVNLTAEVIAAPVFKTSLTEVNESIEYGTTKTLEMIVENTGGNPLEFAIAEPEWLKVAEKGIATSQIPEFTYAYKTSKDVGGPKYQYEDIVETGTLAPYLNMFEMDNFWEEVELSFEFEFYSKKYSKMYIGANGLVSFTPGQEGEFAFGGWNIPTKDPVTVNNFIAPCFAFAGYADERVYPETGIYYQVFDDRAVVSWNDFINLFATGTPVSYQVILYKNGNIKFQYDLAGTDYTTQYGIIGVENEDGTDGVQIGSRARWLEDKMAIVLTPAKKQTIAAGESKTFDVTVDATQLFDGNYSSELSIITNDPLAKQVKIPANLEVIGKVDITAPDSLDYGEIMSIAIPDAGPWDPQFESYTQEFEIVNNGSATLSITGANFSQGADIYVEAFYGMLDWGGNPMDPSWNQVGSMLWAPITVKPKETLPFRAVLAPSGAVSEVVDTLHIKCNTPEGVISIPLSATVSLPPVINISTEDIDVYAVDDNLQESRTVVIDNTDGQSELTYTLAIDFQRQSSNKATSSFSYSSNLIAPAVVIEGVNSGISLNSTKEEEEFNRVLDHINREVADNRIGYGETTPFTAATRFTAPADGFNLSHVKTWYASNGLLDSKINVEILGKGSSIESAKVIYSEELEYSTNEIETNGKWITLELSEEVHLYPNEDFYISITYQTGVTHPQGFAMIDEHIYDTFYYGFAGSWYETAASGYEGMSWLMKAAEMNAVEGVWVELTSDAMGTIPVGEFVEVTLDFNSKYAQSGYNAANLVVSSNDPISPEKHVAVTLYKNQAPVFEAGTLNATVKENETLTFTVTAQDAEGDTITYTLKEEYELLSAETTEEGFAIRYNPDFESAGTQVFAVLGQDQYGNVSEMALNVDVINVNRAPELVGTIETREYYEDEEFDYIDLLPIFNDPDNEVLSYDVSIDNPIATIFTSEDEMAIRPLEPGDATITVIASDSEGLSVETTFEVKIGTVTGIEDIEGKGTTKVYPVPTTGPLNIVLGNEIEGEVNISILNLLGISQFQTVVNKGRGEYTETLGHQQPSFRNLPGTYQNSGGCDC